MSISPPTHLLVSKRFSDESNTHTHTRALRFLLESFRPLRTNEAPLKDLVRAACISQGAFKPKKHVLDDEQRCISSTKTTAKMRIEMTALRIHKLIPTIQRQEIPGILLQTAVSFEY